jgi:sugar fermentation stimulation protein A
MQYVRLYDAWEKASFINRLNRFTLLLKKNGKTLKAYLPNTGRIEEYLTEGNTFYITPSPTQKFAYRIVSTRYQNNYVLLDTIKMNSLAEALILKKLLPFFHNVKMLKREIPCDQMRVDFFLDKSNGPPGLLEVKTCTLCHNGVALFPDAPSRRASHHLKALHSLGASGYDPAMLFIIPNGSAKVFMPNFHTDYDFSMKVLSEVRVKLIAVKVELFDPVTVDFDSVEELPVDFVRTKKNCTPAGSYILVLKNDRDIEIAIGKLGKIFFMKGYYAYVGSAMGSLENRVKRHGKKKKTLFWHIDYITPHPMKIEKTFLFRRIDRIEFSLAERMKEICAGTIEGFGSSDTGQPSHLFYFRNPPHRSRPFMTIIMDFRTFSE